MPRKNLMDQLVAERYFVWAVVFAVVVGGGLLAQISLAKVQLDTESIPSSYLTVPHNPHPVVHKKK